MKHLPVGILIDSVAPRVFLFDSWMNKHGEMVKYSLSYLWILFQLDCGKTYSLGQILMRLIQFQLKNLWSPVDYPCRPVSLNYQVKEDLV